MSDYTYKFDVKLSCEKCPPKVKKALEGAEGITSYNINLERQEVVVRSPKDYNYVLEQVKKSGREVRSGETVETTAE